MSRHALAVAESFTERMTLIRRRRRHRLWLRWLGGAAWIGVAGLALLAAGTIATMR